MTEPNQHEVVAKAKALAHEDGLLWDTEEDPQLNPGGIKSVVDDPLRAAYLNRARRELRRGVRTNDDGF